jgi:hypothetical protein
MVADLRKVMKLNRAQSLQKAGRIEESLAVHGRHHGCLNKQGCCGCAGGDAGAY